MDTFARLRRLENEPLIELSNDPHLNKMILNMVHREGISIAYGRAIWARIAIVGWAFALISIGFHVF